jgi:hypothetical protein
MNIETTTGRMSTDQISSFSRLDISLVAIEMLSAFFSSSKQNASNIQ